MTSGGGVGNCGGPAVSGSQGMGVGIAEPAPRCRVAAQPASSKSIDRVVAGRASILPEITAGESPGYIVRCRRRDSASSRASTCRDLTVDFLKLSLRGWWYIHADDLPLVEELGNRAWAPPAAWTWRWIGRTDVSW